MKKIRVIEAILIVTFLITMMVVYVNTTLKQKDAYVEPYRAYEPFGYETSHDEYIDNKPSGRYTKSGVRILSKNER
jgi:hypothetical protein